MCERIDTLSINVADERIYGNSALADVYEEQIDGQISDLQRLTLEITRLAAEDTNENNDEGSVFAEGELNAKDKAKEPDRETGSV